MRLKTLTLLLGGISLAAFMTAGAPSAHADQITLHALMEDVPESTIIEAMLPQFEKETGIKVQFQKLVYSEMHDKLVPQLTASSSYYNLLEVDFLWAGEFPEAGWLAGYRCAIHWENMAAARAQFPNVHFVEDLFVIDRDRLTCSGGIAPLDMMLALIYARLGAEMAAEEAYAMTRRLAREEGIFVGVSAGGNVAGALRLAEELPEGQAAVIVTILCDGGAKYLSEPFWGKK